MAKIGNPESIMSIDFRDPKEAAEEAYRWT